MSERFSSRCREFFYKCIDLISFNSNIRDLTDMLNRKAGHSEEFTADLLSHPGGFTRAFRKRRMGMAESYIRIAQDLDRNNVQERLHALKILMQLSFHAKTVSMPLNTARVQTEIMKEAVKNLHDRRRQMEMIADFSLVSYGHEAVIRRFLRELKRVEVPENGRTLREMDMGWDSHVHDNLSAGRKTPSQLILDAFIKGLSRVTLAYYDLPHRDIIYESMKAGRILGTDVSVAIEFSVGSRSQRRHFLFVPPTKDYQSYLDFFNRNCKKLSPFVDGLEENRKRRKKVISEILDNFNSTYRITLNQGYGEDSIFALKPLLFEDLERIVPHGQYSRNHLSELLYSRLKEKLRRRVMALKVQYTVASQQIREDAVSEWEMERIAELYRNTRDFYTRMTPADIAQTYFSGKDITDYDSAFLSEEDLMPELKKTEGTIVFARPLERGLKGAVSTVIANHAFIDKIEVMNMHDSMERDPSEISLLTRFVYLINNGSGEEIRQFLEDWFREEYDENLMRRAFEKYHQDALIPLAASASTGWVPRVPGMGFIRESSIPPKSRKYFTRTHYRLPRPVSALIAGKGRGISEKKYTDIYCLGKSGNFKPNTVGDEKGFERISIPRLWRYLNPAWKNLLRVGTGIIPAWLWIGPAYALLWFAITFFRNIFVDLVAFSGPVPKRWTIRNINFDNTAQSLFWTGFSVPVLGMVKQGFDYAWPFALHTLFFEWSKFFFICIANGIYISTHNKIRQFDNRVIRANFFRSILAWPFSALFAPVGNLFLIPSIVQAKFWSDMVAAVIEGTGKFHQKIVLRKRDLAEILPLLRSRDKETRLTAMLDILYIWAVRQRGQTGLGNLITEKKKFWRFSKKEEKKTADRSHLEIMLELYNPQRSQLELSHFIVGRYTSREAVVLTELLNANLVIFHAWLKKLGKKTDTEESIGI
ncbi:MAG: hypothetical protein V2I97_25135 [Desulfococcaceae bacterium]|jgi:hypothetical protein|nr:hypothetical protein [Desulfococcaceae bacterium]